MRRSLVGLSWFLLVLAPAGCGDEKSEVTFATVVKAVQRHARRDDTRTCQVEGRVRTEHGGDRARNEPGVCVDDLLLGEKTRPSRFLLSRRRKPLVLAAARDPLGAQARRLHGTCEGESSREPGLQLRGRRLAVGRRRRRDRKPGALARSHGDPARRTRGIHRGWGREPRRWLRRVPCDPQHGAAFPGYLLRWRIGDLAAGRLDKAQRWTGRRGWEAASNLHRAPTPIMQVAGPECSLTFDRRLDRWVHVRSDGFGATTIVVSFAPRIEGPWSKPRFVFRPPESNRPDANVYAAKGHPELTGADLAVTYATKTYPRFVRLTFSRR
jgi:hypothetical protein